MNTFQNKLTEENLRKAYFLFARYSPTVGLNLIVERVKTFTVRVLMVERSLRDKCQKQFT